MLLYIVPFPIEKIFFGERNYIMAKRCTRCGNFLMDDERFCTRCGENVSNIPPEGQPTQPAQGIYNAGPDNSFGRNEGYSSPANYTNTYNNPYATPIQKPSEEMSLGKWVLTIIVTTFFGIISLIFLFIWGFGDGPESRKNYCKAMLIVEVISLVLGIVLWFVLMGIIGSMAGGLGDYLEKYAENYQYGSAAATSLLSFLGM